MSKSDKIWTIQKNIKLNSEKILENTEENSKKIKKIQKKIVKRYEKYGRMASRIMIRFGKYRRKL